MNSTVPAPNIAHRLGGLTAADVTAARGRLVMPARRFLDHLLVAALQRAVRARTGGRRCHGLSPNTCTSMWRGG
jgi:hypothetical protein